MSHKHLDEPLSSWIQKNLKPDAISPTSALAAVGCALLAFAALLVSVNFFQEPKPKPAGCRPIGMRDGSNLEDELDPKYLEGAEQSSGTWKVKSIFLYPIKSTRGVEMSKSEVVSTGLKYDRQFCFAQLKSPFPVSEADPTEAKAAHTWKFVTIREFPLLSQVKTEVWIPDSSVPGYRSDLPYVVTGGAIVVTCPWQADGVRGMIASWFARLRGSVPENSFVVPFNPTEEQIQKSYTQEKFQIWKETVTAVNMGVHVAPELKYYLGVRNPFTLFRVLKNREVYRTAPRKEELGYQPVTGFADAFPLHLLGVSSMQELSRTQASGSPSLSLRRFRPNIVVEGAPPYEEEKWKKILIGGQLYYVACRCVRCLIPNVNPDTGVRHGSEPNRTLRATRNVDAGSPLLGCLGMNAVPAKEHGTISVGDEIRMVEEGEHVYIPL